MSKNYDSFDCYLKSIIVHIFVSQISLIESTSLSGGIQGFYHHGVKRKSQRSRRVGPRVGSTTAWAVWEDKIPIINRSINV